MFDFLSDGDPRWDQLTGGYRTQYNPFSVLTAVAKNPKNSAIWQEIWLNLYHQNDIGTASYVTAAALITLREAGVMFDWNLYAFIAGVEAYRHDERNPDLPEWLKASYDNAWTSISPLCIDDMAAETQLNVLRAYLATLALAKRHRNLGALLITIDDSEIIEWLDDH